MSHASLTRMNEFTHMNEACLIDMRHATPWYIHIYISTIIYTYLHMYIYHLYAWPDNWRLVDLYVMSHRHASCNSFIHTYIYISLHIRIFVCVYTHDIFISHICQSLTHMTCLIDMRHATPSYVHIYLYKYIYVFSYVYIHTTCLSLTFVTRLLHERDFTAAHVWVGAIIRACHDLATRVTRLIHICDMPHSPLKA